jgi:hypothetical protein
MRKGESILIHAGTGGVGQAAAGRLLEAPRVGAVAHRPQQVLADQGGVPGGADAHQVDPRAVHRALLEVVRNHPAATIVARGATSLIWSDLNHSDAGRRRGSVSQGEPTASARTTDQDPGRAVVGVDGEGTEYRSRVVVLGLTKNGTHQRQRPRELRLGQTPSED